MLILMINAKKNKMAVSRSTVFSEIETGKIRVNRKWMYESEFVG
jgi:hypothetical protein